MYVHMYVCTHVRMYTCTYVHMYVCTHVRMYTCTYVHMYVCTHVRMYVHMYVCMYTCMYVCTYVYTCMYVHMYVHVLHTPNWGIAKLECKLISVAIIIFIRHEYVPSNFPMKLISCFQFQIQ